jgi:hypothetical protein
MSRTAALHEASHFVCAIGSGCKPGSVWITRDGGGFVQYRRHSPECRRGGWCAVAGPIGTAIDLGRLDAGVLKQCAKDFAQVRGIPTTNDVQKVAAMLSRRWDAIEALASALVERRTLTAKEATRIVKSIPSSRVPLKTFRGDALDDVIAGVVIPGQVRQDRRSTLRPAISVPPGACACDVAPGAGDSCDVWDMPFSVHQDAASIRIEKGADAYDRFLKSALAEWTKGRSTSVSTVKEDMKNSSSPDPNDLADRSASGANSAKAKDKSAAPVATADDLEDDLDGDCECDPDDDDCDCDDEDSDAMETLDSVDLAAVTAAARKRSANAYRADRAIPKTVSTTSTDERSVMRAMRARTSTAWTKKAR